MQGKHAYAMIVCVAHKQVAGANADANRLIQLARSGPDASKTRNGFKSALAGIETLQLRFFRIEQINAAVRPQRHIGRNGESAKAAVRFKRRTCAFRSESKGQ